MGFTSLDKSFPDSPYWIYFLGPISLWLLKISAIILENFEHVEK